MYQQILYTLEQSANDLSDSPTQAPTICQTAADHSG
jgi:hypothetical protein